MVFFVLFSLLLQPSAVETDSEEYRTHNETESDIDMDKGGVVIQDLDIIQVNHHLGFRSEYLGEAGSSTSVNKVGCGWVCFVKCVVESSG